MVLKKERLYDMDRLKGTAIFLVVLGHLIAKGVLPEGAIAEWYLYLREFIYKFHMPLFMFTSGAIFFYTYDKYKPTDLRSYWSYAAAKLQRLLPAYIAFSIIIFLGKNFASYIIHVDNVKYNILSDVIDILIYPSRSAGGSLWYIYVLFQMYMFAPIVLKLANGRYYLLVIMAIILHFIPITSYFMLDRLFEYTLYFVLGIIAIRNYGSYIELLKKYSYIFVLMFLASFATIDYVSETNSKLIIGVLSIPAFHSIVLVSTLNRSNALLVLSKYTFSIYLMNTIAIGLAKGILFKFIYWDGYNFILFFFALLSCGLLVPIIVKKYIFSRFDYINRMTN